MWVGIVEAEALTELPKGAVATVTGFVEGDETGVRKLLALGIAPGDELLVLAKYPSVVFELGSTSYAIDDELATLVLVSRHAI